MSPNLQLFDCNLCDKSFTSNGKLSNHIQIHTTVFCDVCGKTFTTKDDLKVHMVSHDSGEIETSTKHYTKMFHHKNLVPKKSFICDICEKVLSSENYLKEHKNLHTNDFKYECDQCPKKFKQRKGLYNHKRTHHDKPKVKDTNKQMKNVNIVNKRKASLITDSKNLTIVCPKCPKRFGLNIALIKHLKSHKKDNIHKDSNVSCDKSNTLNEDVKSDIRSHAVKRPYLCNICFKSYKEYHSLSQHLTKFHNFNDIEANLSNKSKEKRILLQPTKICLCLR